jgi:hypothetical protein
LVIAAQQGKAVRVAACATLPQADVRPAQADNLEQVNAIAA